MSGGYACQTVEYNVIDVTPDVPGQFSLTLVTPEGKMSYMELWLICVIYRVYRAPLTPAEQFSCVYMHYFYIVLDCPLLAVDETS